MQLAIGSLLVLKSANRLNEKDPDQKSRQRNESNDWHMLSPSVQNLVSEFVSIAKASEHSLLIHGTPCGRAATLDSWGNEPTQPDTLKKAASLLDEGFQFGSDASRWWLHALQQLIGGKHADQRSILDRLTTGH
jgi:hypothetical protein